MFHHLQYIFGKNEARKKGSESEKMVSSIMIFHVQYKQYHLLTNPNNRL